MLELQPYAEQVAQRLIARNETIAVAESAAGGLITAALLAVPGASRYCRGGAVLYTREALLGLKAVRVEALAGMRGATEPYALLIAQTVRASYGADWAIGESGAAGPTGNRYGDPAGHACLAIAGRAERSATIATGSTDRSANMIAFSAAALKLAAEVIGKA
jgi:nicotinamide-nucleotide amidase